MVTPMVSPMVPMASATSQVQCQVRREYHRLALELTESPKSDPAARETQGMSVIQQEPTGKRMVAISSGAPAC